MWVSVWREAYSNTTERDDDTHASVDIILRNELSRIQRTFNERAVQREGKETNDACISRLLGMHVVDMNCFPDLRIRQPHHPPHTHGKGGHVVVLYIL